MELNTDHVIVLQRHVNPRFPRSVPHMYVVLGRLLQRQSNLGRTCYYMDY